MPVSVIRSNDGSGSLRHDYASQEAKDDRAVDAFRMLREKDSLAAQNQSSQNLELILQRLTALENTFQKTCTSLEAIPAQTVESIRILTNDHASETVEKVRITYKLI
mmetsp:Transcript_9842/g.17742  ORF Transcript_9842/g.17742 Transcript_9842/m.17742 type:complete len:107 (-) Transcript_9842:826-1146(-)